MIAPATSLPAQASLLELSRQIAGIWALLSRGIGLWAGQERCQQRATSLPMLVQTRAGRLVARLQAILALLAAGRRPRVYPPRLDPTRLDPMRPAPAESAAPPRDDPAGKPRRPRLPGRIGWLMPKAIEIRWAASQLRRWLADPATRAVLAEMPQARRPLAALCRMLAIPPWPLPPDGPPPPPKPRVRTPRPRAPRPTAAAAERALLWQHRSIETDKGLHSPTRRPWWLPRKRS